MASRARSSSVAARRDRPDAVVLGEPSHRGEVRDRLAAELATRGAQAPVVLAAVDDGLDELEPELTRLGDTLLVHANGRPAADDQIRAGRTVLVHDRRAGDGPPLSGNGIVSLAVDASDSRSEAAPRGDSHTSACSTCSSARGSPST